MSRSTTRNIKYIKAKDSDIDRKNLLNRINDK